MSTVDGLVLTLLYVPADRPDRVAKALASEADVVIVDLEDAVAPHGKGQARGGLPELLAACERPVQVRVNGTDTPWGRDDLAMVARLPAPVAVRLPKVESATTVEQAASRVGPGRSIHCLIETALGVEQAFEIARCDAVASIGLGEQDLKSELGVTDDRVLQWPRGRIVNAAAAAGLSPPAQSVFPRVRDLDGLRHWCRSNREQGFLGGAAIHPGQIAVIRESYRPSAGEVGRARAVIAALDEAAGEDSGVALLDDGSFVDAAMAGAARRVLAVAALAEATRSP